ncbi:MAG TPA: GreA/GreB family elongation factor [Flavipsychrobacter sp.]|nr:GreA/GreB family elongation factor [Flavipsychrobacter sp.]
MKTMERNPVVVTEEDYNLLRPFMDRMPDKNSDMSLAYELNRAVVVKKDAFPPHAIRLNSKVSVLDLETDKVHEFTIVMPEQANIREQKISVLTPMGTALIGFRKAEEVRWKVPAGLKRFRILDVVNAI